jgi:hypothetical protein
MTDIKPKKLEKFLRGVMDVERKYANELREQKSARQNDLKGWLDKFVTQELESENPED